MNNPQPAPFLCRLKYTQPDNRVGFKSGDGLAPPSPPGSPLTTSRAFWRDYHTPTVSERNIVCGSGREVENVGCDFVLKIMFE